MIGWALAGVVTSVVAELAGVKWLVFVASVLGIIPLAALIGEATEDLAVRIGPRVGGVLNAPFAHLPRLIVSALLVPGGEGEGVELAITGGVIGHLLPGLGAA